MDSENPIIKKEEEARYSTSQTGETYWYKPGLKKNRNPTTYGTRLFLQETEECLCQNPAGCCCCCMRPRRERKREVGWCCAVHVTRERGRWDAAAAA
jgi:hypothetical protein